MKEKRKQYSIASTFFLQLRVWGTFGEPFGEAAASCGVHWEEQSFNRYTSDTILNEDFLLSLKKRELQRFNLVCTGKRGNLKSTREDLIKNIIESFKSSGSPTKTEEVEDNVVYEINEEVSEEDSGISSVQPNEPFVKQIACVIKEDNVIKLDSNTLNQEEESESDIFNAKDTIGFNPISLMRDLHEKVDILIELITNPIISNHLLGKSKIEVQVKAALGIETEDFTLLGIQELKDLAKTIGVDENQYRHGLEQNIRDTKKYLLQISMVSDTFQIPLERAEEAVQLHRVTNFPIEKAVKIVHI